MRYIILAILMMALFGCEQMPPREIYNINKPISEYDTDLYKCKMMAMQMNPQQPNNYQGTDTDCHVLYGTLRCQERPVRDQSLFKSWQSKELINRQTDECMTRQGWSYREIGNVALPCNTSRGCPGTDLCINNICQRHPGLNNNLPKKSVTNTTNIPRAVPIMQDTNEPRPKNGELCTGDPPCDVGLGCFKASSNKKRCKPL